MQLTLPKREVLFLQYPHHYAALKPKDRLEIPLRALTRKRVMCEIIEITPTRLLCVETPESSEPGRKFKIFTNLTNHVRLDKPNIKPARFAEIMKAWAA